MQKLFSVLAAIATALSAVAGLLQAVNPKYAVLAMAVSGLISAVTPKLQEVWSAIAGTE